jgi:hypothetical protein
MLGAGLTQSDVSRALDIPQSTISTWLRDEATAQLVNNIRQSIRAKHVQTVHDAADMLKQRIQQSLVDGTSKDVDALTRAQLNLEKVAASASGEGMQGALGGKVTVEIILPEWAQRRGRVIDATLTATPTRALGASRIDTDPAGSTNTLPNT